MSPIKTVMQEVEWMEAHFVDAETLSHINAGEFGRVTVLEPVNARETNREPVLLKVYEGESPLEVQQRFIGLNKVLGIDYQAPQQIDPKRIQEYCRSHFRLTTNPV
jgi:hypothetical protein